MLKLLKAGKLAAVTCRQFHEYWSIRS